MLGEVTHSQGGGVVVELAASPPHVLTLELVLPYIRVSGVESSRRSWVTFGVSGAFL